MKKNLENLTIPKTKELRQEKLDEAVAILKSEFVGLDDIIDSIKKSIIPWYITPEIIERPVVISLWGLTGTGKTSVVRRLTSLLGLSGKTVFFDCGLEANESSSGSIADKIEEVFDCDDDCDSISSGYEKFGNAVFVFDEFQYARTLGENGHELLKSPLRPIWTIIDSGKVSVSEYRYDISRFSNFVEDFSEFAKEYPDIHVDNGKVLDREEVKIVLENLGLFYYGRDVSSLLGGEKNSYAPKVRSSDREDEEDDIFKPLSLIGEDNLRTMVKRLNSFKARLGFEMIIELNNVTTLIEYSKILEDAARIITKPKELDCSRSLVFILGNLDEAFKVESDLDPDMDADTFYDKTSKVSISDIKEALKQRFRAEQIARLGNNLIKYPTLKKEHFIKIIKKELSRIADKFLETEGIKINYAENIVDLMYSEGVFPVQGVRPIYTTIGTLLTPLLSDILINRTAEDKEVTITLTRETDLTEKKLKIDKTSLSIIFGKPEKVVDIEIPLQLGELRNPERRLTRFINSVHEAGHAIVALYETGIYPVNIVSVSTGDGGFCNTYDPKKEGEIDSRKDVDSDVRICLAGYEAEKLVYGKYPEKCLMGSGSDIENAWDFFSEMAYRCGYFEPYSYTNHLTEENSSGIPSGFLDNEGLFVKHPYKASSGYLRDMVALRFSELRQDVVNILKEERKLLKVVALYLGENGSMNSDEFRDFVIKYGNKLTDKYVSSKLEEDKNWYEKILNKF